MGKKNGMKNYGLWISRSRIHYLKSERPLIFNFYKNGSDKWSYSTQRITLDELKDPNIKIAIANVDYEIARLIMSIKKLEEELQAEKDETCRIQPE